MKATLNKTKPEAIVIGTSAGGIDALIKILPTLPKSYCLPIIIVLHISASQPSLLSAVFEHKIKMKIKEADEKESILPGTIYFAPPGYHLLIEKNKTFSLTVDEPVQYARPSIDVMFESGADAYGASLVAILMTGANEDGASGIKRIIEAGGLGIVEDPKTAKFPFMPASAMPFVRPENVLSLSGISTFLLGLSPDQP